MRRQDILLHHPYDSFATSVQAFVEQAAADPDVLAIKQTLYRTSGDSPLVDALVDAAEAGKQVLVVVEIKARFDEQANIKWARALEHAGCHVVYGVVGLKTHCKLALVVRQEPDGSLRRYVHIGTGNYNPKTARLYEDFGLLTVEPRGHGRHRRPVQPPVGLHQAARLPHPARGAGHAAHGLLDKIHRESRQCASRPAEAGITMKLNSLVDEEIIDALYDASRAGVPDRPHHPRHVRACVPAYPGCRRTSGSAASSAGSSSTRGCFRFRNGGEEQLWIGSADAMHRNLDRRVEALVHVTRPGAGRRAQRGARAGHRPRDLGLGAATGRQLGAAHHRRVRRAAARTSRRRCSRARQNRAAESRTELGP